MNKNLFSKLLIATVLAVMLVGMLLVPVQNVQAKSELVGFTFTNNSDKLASLRLYSSEKFYYFLVLPGQTRYFTPVRDEYRATFYSCGHYVNDPLDLTKQYTLVVPPCGTVAHNGNAPAGVIDGGKVLKLVKVTFENETGNYMKVILTGPQTHVFTFGEDEAKTYTISKGTYDFTVYGCKGSFTGTYESFHNRTYEFKCP